MLDVHSHVLLLVPVDACGTANSLRPGINKLESRFVGKHNRFPVLLGPVEVFFAKPQPLLYHGGGEEGLLGGDAGQDLQLLLADVLDEPDGGIFPAWHLTLNLLGSLERTAQHVPSQPLVLPVGRHSGPTTSLLGRRRSGERREIPVSGNDFPHSSSVPIQSFGNLFCSNTFSKQGHNRAFFSHVKLFATRHGENLRKKSVQIRQL